jgi:hypothetical protein
VIGWIRTPQYILLKAIKDSVEAAVAVASVAAAAAAAAAVASVYYSLG